MLEFILSLSKKVLLLIGGRNAVYEWNTIVIISLTGVSGFPPLLCCVQVQGASASAVRGGARPAQKELADWTRSTGGSTAAVTGRPTKCHRGPQYDRHMHLHTQVHFCF